MPSPIPVAILDDYQHVAFKFADWTPVKGKLDITVFDTTVLDEDELVKRLEKYEIISTMRERTKFTAGVLDRLPNLKLLTTTGMVNRGIDVDHAQSKGIVVSGTARVAVLNFSKAKSGEIRRVSASTRTAIP